MYEPTRIIDSHIHLITAETHRVKLESMSKLDSVYVEAYHQRWQESLTARNEGGPEASPADFEAVAEKWEKELDRAGIEKAVFFTSDEVHTELVRFVSMKPDRFIGYSTFDPTDEKSAGMLEKQIEEDGVRGIKLYPMKRHFHVNDPACFPVFEVCQEKQIPVLIHFGLSISATHDLSYGHPLDLSTPALRFPAVKWVIPHFGTGFFREVLLLAAQYGNVYIDTSSSNAWIRHSPYPLTLKDLFERTYETVGAKRIVFGTDSSFFPRGFRKNILEEQLRICNELGLKEEEIDNIFHHNIVRILRLT
jgi:predicted TIM-barrel fold metal-dependent hydrolase